MNIVLDDIQLFNLNLLLNKSYYPLENFMNEIDYNSVLNNNKLSNSKPFKFPITLQVTQENYNNFINNKLNKINLVNEFNKILATLEDIVFYKPNVELEYKLYKKEFIPYFYSFGDYHIE